MKSPNLGMMTPFPLINYLATKEPRALQIDRMAYSSIGSKLLRVCYSIVLAINLAFEVLFELCCLKICKDGDEDNQEDYHHQKREVIP